MLTNGLLLSWGDLISTTSSKWSLTPCKPCLDNKCLAAARSPPPHNYLAASLSLSKLFAMIMMWFTNSHQLLVGYHLLVMQ